MRLQQSMNQYRQHIDDMDDEDQETEEEDVVVWAWRKLLSVVVGKKEEARKTGADYSSADTYNLYQMQHDFENAYGWSVAVDENVYPSLRSSDIGVYLVNLTAVRFLPTRIFSLLPHPPLVS